MKLTAERHKKITEDFNALWVVCEKANDYRIVDTNKLRLLQYAAALGELEKINLVLEKGVNFKNIGVTGGNTALHFAVKYENTAVANRLLSAGASIIEVKITQFEMNNKEITAYYIAQLKKAIDDNHITNNDLDVILLDAARTGNWEIASAVLELGANLNYTDSYFNLNALFYAIINNHIEFARKLLKAKRHNQEY